ncbi:MAG: class I SAM-dependent DNA methyltransferase, partial [Chloroflexi bacterium]|nr:class I SAM-dependent DNA methyltransferase [Chloroflexota bacterium]
MTAPTDLPAFIAKWRDNARRERASSQEHFLDLCRLTGTPTPNEADPTGAEYTFEAGAGKTSGGAGWADVWRRGYFGWEYKGAGRDLAAAYRQLLDYREALENPPLLVVSDMDRIEVHTNFTNTRPAVHALTLDTLAREPAEGLRVLRAVMTDPESLRPARSPEEVTAEAAARFAEIARSMGERGEAPERVAHFLNRVLFCLFAEDVGLLPRRLLTSLIESRRSDPAEFGLGLTELFWRMSDAAAGRFYGNERVEWFNGGLFDGPETLAVTRDELDALHAVALLDWSQVEPSILGTLFERGLDPAKRGQLGAHYTDRAKILQVVEPVVLTPLRRELAAMQARVEELMAGRPPSPLTREGRRRAQLPAWEAEAEAVWRAFLGRLRAVRVLDPACGSGNFLYVTLRLLKDLEFEAIRWGGARLGVTGEFPRLGPANLLGIEINPYAKELAGVSIWVGQFQWMIEHGYGFPEDPVLQPLDNIELRDAILARDAGGRPVPAEWPAAEFIVGNPPFLGTKMVRMSLGDAYVDDMFAAWDGEVSRESDLACYWHEQARRHILAGTATRAGLLATNSIRGGPNRRTLARIKETGDIFMAWSDEPWIVEGAAVRVSIVGQDDGSEAARVLDGTAVSQINSSLGSGVDLARAVGLRENMGVSFQGDSKVGAFDITGDVARKMLMLPSNVNGRPNSDVVVPWVNGMDITRRPRGMFIVDFGVSMTAEAAADYEAPFAHVEEHVRPVRATNRRKFRREHWWIHGEAVPGVRSALAPLRRFIATPTVAKHRLFVWLSAPTLPDHQLIVVAREDDHAFGVLHSRAHQWWALRAGSSHVDRPRYTPTTTFETFPFPWPLDTPEASLTAAQRAQRDAIAAAARDLDAARRHWLNPPELVREEPDVAPSLPPRLLPVSAEAAAVLKTRTLTNLYNDRPSWLAQRHA